MRRVKPLSIALHRSVSQTYIVMSHDSRFTVGIAIPAAGLGCTAGIASIDIQFHLCILAGRNSWARVSRPILIAAVTPTDIRGTAVIVLGVILIMIFSSINHGLQQSISVDR
jgi:hypothetical protein